MLDQLESGPWPSFVSDIKQEAASRAKNPKGLDYQIPADCPEDLLGVLELSYNEKETHWKHGGIVGVFGYGGGVIGRYCDQPEMFPGVAHFHTMRMSGLEPCGVLCELTLDDGEMARLPEVASFARAHNMASVAAQ